MKIILVNAITKQKIVYHSYPAHSSLNYNQLLRIIKIFQRSLKPEQVLIQLRNNDGWRYIHHQFCIKISHIQEEVHVRYKIYKETTLTPDDRKSINRQVDLCVQRLKIYKNIDTNIIDFNFFWASPFEKQIINYSFSDPKTNKEHNLIDWKIRTNGYFKQLGQTIKAKKKKALLYINTFNSECFKYRTQYQIVYIVCHTEKEQNGSDQKYYLVGENNGAVNKVYVQDFYKMLKEKRIQLLILYSSCMNEHKKQLKENKNIQNILLIDESPLHEQKSILLYMKQFFSHLLKGQSIKRAHELSVEQIASDLQTKFILIEKEDKKFQFNDGELQGDYIYLKGFTNKNKLLSNRILLIQLIRTFCFDEISLDCFNFSYKIFNAYNEQCSDKSVFIPEIKCQLMKRKIFKEVIIQTSFEWQKVNFKPRDSETLYILFGHKFSPVEIKKLQKLCVNVLLLTNQDLHIKKYDQLYNSSPIQPLNKIESLHFLKHHRKLTKKMEEKVQKFIEFTWREDLKHLYYPFNFDYNSLMSIIAQFNLTTEQQHIEYEKFKLLVRKLSQQKFNDYLFIMTIISHTHENEKTKLISIIKNLNFYKELQKIFAHITNNNDEKFLQLNNQYFRIIYEDFFHEIYPHLSQILLIFVKSTFELDVKGESLNKKSIWFYEATTVTKKSQISILLKSNKEMVKKYENILVSSDVKYFLKECDGYTLINTGLNIAKNILSFFDIFDSRVNQNKKPSELLFLCLLMVNNAIIYRKSTDVLKRTEGIKGNLEIIFKQKKNNQIILNQEKDETKNYFEQEQESQQYEDKKKSRFLKCINGFFTKRINQKQDFRFYSEEDFVIKVDCLTRKGLLYILSKIRNKLGQSTQLLAACNSLAIQLQLQPGYEGKAFDEDNLSVLLKQNQSAMDNWSRDDLPAKYRIGYDILMCLILVNTRCGREKMNQHIWQKINQHQKELFYRQLLQIQTPVIGQQRYFEGYIEYLCQSRQMHQQLIQHMRNFRRFQSQEQRQEQISKQYYIVVQLWSKCNEYIKNIQNNIKPSQSFTKLLKLKLELSTKLTKKQYTQQFHVYSMVCTLADYVTGFLSQISNKLVIILTNKILNFEQIIQECDIDESQLIIVYVSVNLNEDMIILQQIKCKFLLVSLSNAIKRGEIEKQICSISSKFVFVCENSIRSKLQEFVLKDQGTKKFLVTYNVEKYKLEEGRSNIIMILLSLYIVKQITDFKLEIQEQVYRCINFILGSSSSNEKDKIERQQRQEVATFSMIHKIVNKLKKNLKLQNLLLTDVDFFINYKKSMAKLDISTLAMGNRDIKRK